nr:septum site-determining protein MinC [Gammaproteobacteria bacterium]
MGALHSSPDDAAAKAFEIKGGLFPLTVLRLLKDNIEEASRQIEELLRKAPDFFTGAPVIIDLKPIENARGTDLTGLITLLQRHSLVPIGVRNGTDQQRQQATAAGLALLPYGDGAKLRSIPEDRGKSRGHKGLSMSRIVSRPVRSGQQIYAAGTDLIVLAAVNAGAEVLADGSIHVYGPLRGRALAGIGGQVEARIFCRSLEAEVIAIAGVYRVLEEPDAQFAGQQVQVYLSQGSLMIESV